MEKGPMLTILFSFVSSLLTSFVGSSVLTSLFNRRWECANKASNILEEQYLKVISPIYKELQLNSSDKEKRISNIGEIISDNFSLLPEQLLDKYKNIADNEDEFETLISDFYILLRNELGYTRIKISKDIKKKGKLLAAKKLITFVDYLVLHILSFLGFFMTILSAYGIYLLSTSTRNITHIFIFSIFLVLGLLLFILSTISQAYFIGSQNNSNKPSI